MTKYKKLTKSAFAIVALSLILVAVLAFGGTYAWFNASASANGTVTTGTLNLDAPGSALELTAVEDSLVPNQAVEVKVSDFKITGNTVSALRMKVTVESAKKGKSNLAEEQLNALKALVDLSIEKVGANGEWAAPTADDGYKYYGKTVVGGVSGIALDTIAKVSILLKSTAGNEYQGVTITYKVEIQAAQAEYTTADDHTTQTYAADVAITPDAAKELPSWLGA